MPTPLPIPDHRPLTTDHSPLLPHLVVHLRLNHNFSDVSLLPPSSTPSSFSRKKPHVLSRSSRKQNLLIRLEPSFFELFYKCELIPNAPNSAITPPALTPYPLRPQPVPSIT